MDLTSLFSFVESFANQYGIQTVLFFFVLVIILSIVQTYGRSSVNKSEGELLLIKSTTQEAGRDGQQAKYWIDRLDKTEKDNDALNAKTKELNGALEDAKRANQEQMALMQKMQANYEQAIERINGLDAKLQLLSVEFEKIVNENRELKRINEEQGKRIAELEHYTQFMEHVNNTLNILVEAVKRNTIAIEKANNQNEIHTVTQSVSVTTVDGSGDINSATVIDVS